MTANNACVRLMDVTIAYDRNTAIRHLTGTFATGSMTAIVGSNGAGKTTLLKALMGEIPIASGMIERVRPSVQEFGYLPQASDIDRSFPISVADTIMLGAWREAGPFRAFGAAAARRGRNALAAVKLTGLENRRIGSLSVGQLQRVLFARLMLQDAKVILLDEPFAAVDSQTTLDLLDIVATWHREGRTVIAALHNLGLVRERFPETLLLARGQSVAWGPTASAMSDANLLEAQRLTEESEHHHDHHGHATHHHGRA